MEDAPVTAKRWDRPSLLFVIAVLVAASVVVASDEERLFLAANSAAMTKMMAGMNVAPTGNVDADFAAAMIPHHQGAIDMALAQLRYGHNEPLRRIAQEIIVTQQQEIAAMKLAISAPKEAAK
jgi:uncharacterized protein (DUF305 family)